jgi:hypothetical protein
MEWYYKVAIVVAGLVYIVGVFTTMSDLLDKGKSLDKYREQYGKDLGMLICCTYRGLMIFAWPAMGGLGFLVGLIRDTIKLAFK